MISNNLNQKLILINIYINIYKYINFFLKILKIVINLHTEIILYLNYLIDFFRNKQFQYELQKINTQKQIEKQIKKNKIQIQNQNQININNQSDMNNNVSSNLLFNLLNIFRIQYLFHFFIFYLLKIIIQICEQIEYWSCNMKQWIMKQQQQYNNENKIDPPDEQNEQNEQNESEESNEDERDYSETQHNEFMRQLHAIKKKIRDEENLSIFK
jgi:hypothetical protein